MKGLKRVALLLLVIPYLVACNQTKENEKAYNPQYELLKVGEVKTAGWMREQMITDLTEGYLSKLLDYCKYIDQDVCNANRVTAYERYEDFQHLGTWWGAEEEYYLKDGMLRMAIQSEHKPTLELAEAWMERLLEYQGEDGYLGMYVAGDTLGTRFNFEDDNAELWVQSRLMSAMLSWYEYTQDERFLTAVERAVTLDISHYMNKNYWEGARGVKGSGVTHAVGFFDILEWLIRLTDDPLYINFTKKYYEDFNKVPTRNNEMSTAKLLDKSLKFQDHTPHIVEGAYMQNLYHALTGDSAALQASKNAMVKIAYHSGPGGGVLGDEDVRGLQGTADTYREYCALPELVFSLNRVLSISGDMAAGDMAELVTYNAAQAARLPDLAAVEYLSSDNRLHIHSCSHAGRLAYDANRATCKNGEVQLPYKQEAVCCVTSAARVLPYFIDGMWMKTKEESGIAAMYYGPTVVNTVIDGVKVTIEELTNYPFSDEITFKISCERPVNFDFKLRIPNGAKDIITDTKAKRKKDDAFVTLSKKWNSGDVVKVKFPFEIEKIAQPVSETVPRPGFYLQRGPLVYALAFPYELEKTMEYSNSGFYRYEVNTLSDKGWDYSIDPKASFSYKQDPNANLDKPYFKSPVYLEGQLMDEKGNYQSVKLVPEGATVVRRVTFPRIK